MLRCYVLSVRVMFRVRVIHGQGYTRVCVGLGSGLARVTVELGLD